MLACEAQLGPPAQGIYCMIARTFEVTTMAEQLGDMISVSEFVVVEFRGILMYL